MYKPTPSHYATASTAFRGTSEGNCQGQGQGHTYKEHIISHFIGEATHLTFACPVSHLKRVKKKTTQKQIKGQYNYSISSKSFQNPLHKDAKFT